MRNMIFHYCGAWNFMPFGSEGVEFHFDKYTNIVLIQGENRDAKPIDSDSFTDDSKISSNGSGKSSIQEIIVWCLYGETVKRPEKIKVDNVIHNKVGKNCRTVVEFDKYRVERSRPTKGKCVLRLWESENRIWDDSTEITHGDSKVTQKEIIKRIGLSYEAFVNICVFTDDQRSCFLECDSDTKREIVENLMQLGIYREWFDIAKAMKKDVKVEIDTKSKEFDLLLGNKADAERRLELTQQKKVAWRNQKLSEKLTLEKNIESKTIELSKSDVGQAIVAYREAQEKITEINLKIPEIESNREKLVERFDLIKQKDADLKKESQTVSDSFNKLVYEMKSYVDDRKKKEKKIEDLREVGKGTRCDNCYEVVQEDNIERYISEIQKEISDINLNIQTCKLNSEEIGKRVEEIKGNQAKLKQIETQTLQKQRAFDDELSRLRNELTAASKVREPKADSAELLLQQQIEELNRQLVSKQKELDGDSPYEDIIENDKLELDKITLGVTAKDTEVKELESKIALFDYWVYGFGPDGIRKWVIDGIIPDLNARVNYWLQFLIDNKVVLNFDNKLNEKIERNPPDGDPYIYYIMSTGQRRRLNLAVGHSFAYITELSADAIPSIIFLDEVTTNVDPLGVQGIYNMICELAEDKQVFVTTHDPDLVKMLQGASVIRLVHENGYTKKLP